MSRKYRFGGNNSLYFISYAVVYWIDVFVRAEYSELIIEGWRYCQKNKGLEIYGWVIMPSHVHMIIGSKEKKLEDIVRDMKRHSSIQMRKAIQQNPVESRREWINWMMERAGSKNSNNRGWQFWQQHNRPIELLNHEMFYQKLDYVHDNPVKAMFVEKSEDWLLSSARDFYGQKGLIDLCYVS